MYVIKEIQKKKDGTNQLYEIVGKIKESDFLSLKKKQEKKEQEKEEGKEKEVLASVIMPVPEVFDLHRYIEGIGADPKTSFISLLFQQMKTKDEKAFNIMVRDYAGILKNARKHVEMIRPEIQASILRVFNDFVHVDVSLLKNVSSIGDYWLLLERLSTDNKTLNIIVNEKGLIWDNQEYHLAKLYINRVSDLEQRQNDLKELQFFFKSKSQSASGYWTPFTYFLPYAKSLRIIDAFGDFIMID